MSLIEQEFKEKSKSLRVSPSPSTWDTLRQRLEEKKQRRSVNLNISVAIAASFIGIIFLVGLLFLKDNPGSDLVSPPMTSTTEFEAVPESSDIYWQIAELNHAYSRLNMQLPSEKKQL